jgi:hypothetical protein
MSWPATPRGPELSDQAVAPDTPPVPRYRATHPAP